MRKLIRAFLVSAAMAIAAVSAPGIAMATAAPGVLPAPSGMHASTSVHHAVITWQAVAGASVYELRITGAGGSGTGTTSFDRVIAQRDASVVLGSGRYVAGVRAGVSSHDVHGHWSAVLPFTAATPVASGAAKAVQFAYSRIGCKYTYGGTGPCSAGYDCSGFVQAAWLSAGVSIPRTTGSQWAALRHVSRSSLQAGDLVFSNGFGHVMMYVGGGNVIESPHTGAFVKKTSLAGVGTINGYARV